MPCRASNSEFWSKQTNIPRVEAQANLKTANYASYTQYNHNAVRCKSLYMRTCFICVSKRIIYENMFYIYKKMFHTCENCSIYSENVLCIWNSSIFEKIFTYIYNKPLYIWIVVLYLIFLLYIFDKCNFVRFRAPYNRRLNKVWCTRRKYGVFVLPPHYCTFACTYIIFCKSSFYAITTIIMVQVQYSDWEDLSSSVSSNEAG